MKIDIPAQKVQYDLVAMFNGKEMARIDVFQSDVNVRIESADDGTLSVSMDEMSWGREVIAELRKFADELEQDIDGLEKKEDGA